MDNLPPAGFQFAGDDYGPVDFPSSLPSDMQAGLNFTGGGPVFPQNQRGTGYTMSPFHMNYSQQSSMAAMTGLPTGTFRSRFSDYPPDQSPHLPMPIPSSAAGMISDRLPSFSTIVSSSGTSTGDIVKGGQALYTSMSAQQLAFQAAAGRGNQSHFDTNNFSDQMASKGYNKSPSLGSASPGMGANYTNNIPHSSIMQHTSHNGSSQHLSPRSYKEDVNQQQYISTGMHIDRGSAYGHGGVAQNSESMTLPKFKHKFLSHNQHPPRRTIGPFKFFIIGKTERPSIFNKGTQTSEETMGELKIKIPKREIYQPESDDFSEEEPERQKKHKGVKNKKGANASPRITFPYDPLPNQGGGDFREYQKNSKLKTVISPSFVDAAGKATMTTCVANKATIVTVGIVSRPQGLGESETTHSSKKGGMATGNAQGYQATPRRGRPPNQSNHQNFEQLMQERKAKARDLEQERMEVSVRIDDTQYIQVGSAKRWQCNECDKSYTTKHNLVMHVLDHSGIKPHLCLKCGKYFKQLSHLNTHMLTHDKIKPHTCNMCGKGFTQISHLKRHTAVSEKNGYCANLRSKRNSGQSPVTSPTQPQLQQSMIQTPQGKRFSDQGQMVTSTPVEDFNDEDSKDPNEGGRLLCRYCDRKFRYPSQLKDHMHTHNGSRPYMCTECGMDFMKEHHLKAHQFTHTGLKPYTCDTCGRSFNQRANLQRHKLIHDTNRTYKCNICQKQFTQPQTLKAHQVVHADRKPFECNICGKEFGRYHNLQGHMHMHSNTKPYVCFCGSTFTLKGNLNRHKKVKHGLNETTDVMEEDAVNFLSSLSERARDDYNADGSMSPGSGGDSMDGKSNRKGRKSIPRKITQGEERGQAQGQPGMLQGNGGNVLLQDAQQQGGAATGGKPFVIQNPDTDDEQEEEEGEIVNPSGPDGEKAFEDLAPMTSVMNFQPLNVQGDDPRLSMKRQHEDEGHDMDKRPRRQSQRRSPKIHSDVDQDDSDGYDGENDNADTDWTPGSKKRNRTKSDV